MVLEFLRRKRRLSDVAAKPALPSLRKLARILVIDDDPNSFPFKPLQSEGYNIEWWGQVDNIGRLEAGEFDIIILDIVGVASQWSSQDGLGVLEHLKNRSPAQIIVAFSGHTFDLSKTRFWKLADETLPKPVDALKCMQVIDNILETTFTAKHYWDGISELLRANGVPQRRIDSLEDNLARAIDDGAKVDYASRFRGLLKTTEHTITLVSLGEKIGKLVGIM
jgi:DNA-binding response OmpR family regulator